MILQVGVKILLENPEGKYLLLKRNREKYPEVTEVWDIVGGRIDPGSTLVDNLKREILEETRLEFTGQPRLVAAQDILRVEGRHVVRLTYIGKISGEPQLDEDHDEYQWLTLNEIRALGGQLDGYFKEVLEKGLIN